MHREEAQEAARVPTGIIEPQESHIFILVIFVKGALEKIVLVSLSDINANPDVSWEMQRDDERQSGYTKKKMSQPHLSRRILQVRTGTPVQIGI